MNYVLNWLHEVLQINFQCVEAAVAGAPSIYYGKSHARSYHIPDCGLLWEEHIIHQEPSVGKWQGIPVIFAGTGGNDGAIPFDLFSAIFFLLSRYEEYTCSERDIHGRFPHQQSILAKLQCLHRPLIDEWVYEFRKWLLLELNVETPEPQFSCSLTYDIDIAFAYKAKGWYRQVGGLIRNILSGNLPRVLEQFSVFSGKKTDPYDSFSFISRLHKESSLPARFFVLVALKVGSFDKNIHPLHPEMQRIIHWLHEIGSVGLHPSYESQQETIFQQERAVLEQTINEPIVHSRQHYIRLRLPDTYHARIARGITDEYSMGYTDTIGFRASTGRSFLWFDLERNQPTSLRIHPFFFMDTAARFGNGYDANTAFRELYQAKELLSKKGSCLTTIFHNFSLGTDKGWQGWGSGYESFVRQLTSG